MSNWLLIAAGLALLTVGADLLIRGAASMARKFGFSELLIGLTLVGFGTSTPELVSSVQAALAGSPGVAVGNVVGSNIANILLILGLSALLAPIPVDPKSFRRDAVALAGATVAVVAAGLFFSYGRITGALFLAGLVGYLAYAYFSERTAPLAPETLRHEEEAAQFPAARESHATNALLIIFGLAGLIAGGKLLVGSAIDLASAYGVSEAVIGLTIVAVGTSLPELVVSAIAAARGKSAMALGNVIGSNIYNSLGILGATALTAPMAAPAQILRVDIWVMSGATLAMVVFAVTGRRLDRREGAILLSAYVIYLAVLAYMSL